MTCYRCRSLMVLCAPMRFHARSTEYDTLGHLLAYRCPCCGYYEDKQIRRNRERVTVGAT
jgi:hypothetical protein